VINIQYKAVELKYPTCYDKTDRHKTFILRRIEPIETEKRCLPLDWDTEIALLGQTRCIIHQADYRSL